MNQTWSALSISERRKLLDKSFEKLHLDSQVFMLPLIVMSSSLIPIVLPIIAFVLASPKSGLVDELFLKFAVSIVVFASIVVWPLTKFVHKKMLLIACDLLIESKEVNDDFSTKIFVAYLLKMAIFESVSLLGGVLFLILVLQSGTHNISELIWVCLVGLLPNVFGNLLKIPSFKKIKNDLLYL